MFRMSQKLLVTFFLLIISIPVGATEWKLLGSIETGPLGIHLKYPLSVFIPDNSKKIYITDFANNRFILCSEKLKPLKQFNAAGQVKTPVGMIKDYNGNLWYIERETNSLVYINLKEKKLVKKTLGIFPDRISIYKDKIAVIDRFTGKIVLISTNFKIIKTIFPKNVNFKGFCDFKVKGSKIYAMENLTGRIFLFNLKNGENLTINLSKRLIQPVSFDIDKNGNIYILDRYMKKVLIFNSEGRFLSSMLKEGERPGELYYPWQLVIKNEKIYIIDEGNGRIDVFKL